MTTYRINEEFNGIEITFESKPAEDIRSTLKENGFRWHKAKGFWYAKQNPERLELAEILAAGNEAPKAKKTKKAAKKAEKVNKYGVKVGDLFYSSWGYDQTNNDFFQVVALVGESSVRVREVRPVVVDTEYISSMAEDITVKNTNEMLPPTDFSVFIKDQENGDLKRLKSYAADGVSHPEFKLDTFANAWKLEGDEMTVYESSYH